MKRLFAVTIAVLFSLSNLLAQKKDSTVQKQRPSPVFNPNARRNGYENYQSSADASGVHLNPGATINTIDHRYEGLRGTPYFLPNWSKGEIDMFNGQHYTNASIKFDALNQRLTLLRTWAGGDSIIINGNQVKAFQLRNEAGEIFQFKRLPTINTDEEILKDYFFLVLVDGENSLFKRVSKKFKPADYKDPYGNNVRYDSFTDNNTYYLLRTDLTFTKIKLSKKHLLDALSDKETLIKAFLDEQKFNFSISPEASSISVIRYYNSL